MPLSAEQQHLIRNRIAADGPSPAAAFALWLFFGLFGAHRFYLQRRRSGMIMAALFLLGLGLAAGGIAFGGTVLDGVFYRPDVSDILRASSSRRGAYLFYGGALALSMSLLWWLADGFAIPRFIRASRAKLAGALADFFQAS